MVTIIPSRVEKIWESWNVRGAILLSFFIQMFLVLFAPLRKRSDNMLVGFAIWSAYLLADWAANFSVGLVTSNNGNNNDAAKDNLMALWAPFLLLHFGGPDTISAFNLEDNLLWLRQIPGLLFKTLALVYVFVVTLPQNALWAPTLLIFVAGIIKYSERACALYVASNKILGEESKESILANETTMERTEQHRREPSRSPLYPARRVHYMSLIDMRPLGYILMKYCDYFWTHANQSHIEALKSTEVLCEFTYELYYTKASILHNKVACIARFAALSSVVVALGLFISMEKDGSYKFDKTDAAVTYVLFYGALFLETISVFRLIFSKWMLVISSESSQNDSYLGHVIKFYRVKILEPILVLQRSRFSKCKKTPYTDFKELSTPFLFRGWCGSISGLNLIKICLHQCRPKKQYLPFKLVEFLEGAFAPYFGAKEMNLLKYKVKSPFFLDLWQFIWADLIYELPRVRGHYHLWEEIRAAIKLRIEFNARSDDLSSALDLLEEFTPHDEGDSQVYAIDTMIPLLHLITDLCYDIDEHSVTAKNRHLVKLLSDYMLYLLLVQPNMMSEVPGYARNLGFRLVYSTLIELIREADPNITDHELRIRLPDLLERSSDPLFQGAGLLARKLNYEFPSYMKWELLGMIWVQMLLFVAYKSRPSIHVQHLSKGGGLISLVWLVVLLARVNIDREPQQWFLAGSP